MTKPQPRVRSERLGCRPGRASNFRSSSEAAKISISSPHDERWRLKRSIWERMGFHRTRRKRSKLFLPSWSLVEAPGFLAGAIGGECGKPPESPERKPPNGCISRSGSFSPYARRIRAVRGSELLKRGGAGHDGPARRHRASAKKRRKRARCDEMRRGAERCGEVS